MSTVVHMSTQFTLIEAAKLTNDGKALAVAEILQKSKPVLNHIPWFEANSQFQNKTAQRYNLPAGSWRHFNAGVASETSQVKQITDTMGMLQSYFEPDKDLVDSMPNPAQYRNDQNAAFVEGFGQTMAYQVWYGNALVDTEKFTGLAPRLNTLGVYNVQGCGGSGSDTSSIFLVQWGPGKVYGIFPRGTSAGLKHEDLGQVTKVDSNALMWQVYRDHYKWDAGIVVEDPKCIGRVANIEVSGTSNIFDEDVLIKTKNQMRNQGQGAIGYCSTNVYSYIMIAIKDKSNVFFPVSDPFGSGTVPSLLGCPLYVDEMISEAETVVA
jgi:hypothetical protein